MKQAVLLRDPDDGVQVTGKFMGYKLFVDTLEKLSTLIKPGTYICTYTRSNRLSALASAKWLKNNPGKTIEDAPDEVKNYFTYEITGVPGRSGLRIHSDNLSKLLEGCVAPGHGYSDINSDGEIDVINSHRSVEEIETYFEKKDFELTIK